MKALLLIAATALLALTALPAAQAAEIGINNPTTSTKTTLYFHLINVQDFPINTQQPDDKWSDEAHFGGASSTATCLDKQTGNTNTGGIGNEYHTFYGYSSPSYVEYNFIQNGVPRTHPERGISYDAVIDPNADFTLYWYLRTSSEEPLGPAAAGDNSPIVVPNVVVKATIRAGDAISVDDKAYNSGETLVHGQTDPVVLAGDAGVYDTNTKAASTQVTKVSGQAGQTPYIYQFAVPMKIDQPKIPRATGYNLRVDIYMDNPQCGDPSTTGSIMPNEVSIYTAPQFRPRMELGVMDPIRLEYLHPQFVGDDLVVHTSMNSAWGNYDVNEDTIQVTITGPSPAPSLARAAVVQRTHEHYHHQEAVDVTYVWPYKTDRALNGLYTVDVKFENDQQTAAATGTAQFEIGKGTVIGCGGVQESSQALKDDCAKTVQKDGVATKAKSPGLELVGVIGVLAAALVVARRHNHK